MALSGAVGPKPVPAARGLAAMERALAKKQKPARTPPKNKVTADPTAAKAALNMTGIYK